MKRDDELPALVRGLTDPRQTKAFRSAWLKGLHAAIAGKTQGDNPYQDVRGNYRERVTFSRAFFREWCHGFKAGEEHLEEAR